MWQRLAMPEELQRIRSMDEWFENLPSFGTSFVLTSRKSFSVGATVCGFTIMGSLRILQGDTICFYNGLKLISDTHHTSLSKENIFLHMAACEADPRCFGQLYTKCRRSGYTNICSAVLVDEASQVKEKLLGIQSKTGKDAQENIFMKKVVVSIFRSYPFFFKPIQDGTTNPRMELAFREPSKRITKNNKTSHRGDALNTVINWKNTTNNAYDGEKLHMLYSMRQESGRSLPTS